MAGQSLMKRLEHSILIADGGMGTMIRHLAPQPVECVEAMNILDPDLVGEIHKQFVRAGAHIIETNTFSASRFSLAKYHFEDKTGEINKMGVKLAKDAVGPDGFVGGSIGPFLATLEEITNDMKAPVEGAIEEQLAEFIAGEVDLVILETFGNSRHLLFFLDVVKKKTALPVLASMTVTPSSTCYDGVDVRTAAGRLVDHGADIVGLNCGYGIVSIEHALKQISDINVPLSVMPNAGYPEKISGRMLYGISADYFAGKTLTFAQLGARIIGGCCGISPSDIEAASVRLRKEKIVRRKIVRKEIHLRQEAPGPKEGILLERFKDVSLPVICEIDPPGTLDISMHFDAITEVHEAGASAISMAENPLATVKINNLAFASYIKQRRNINIILHMTGRDRNLLGLQSFLLGAHLLGIEALLMVTGDPSHTQGGPTNVFDVDSIGLLSMAAELNRGRNIYGKTAGTMTNFSLGAAFNPNMRDQRSQLNRLNKKIDAGACFIMTQPFFEAEKVRMFLETTKDLPVKFFAGIFPITSSRTAEYLHNEVPGIYVPDGLREALAKKSEKEYQKDVGIGHSLELIESIKSSVDGLYLIAPHRDPALLSILVRAARL
ncbi:MAG: bifunctional homocysteine S-methyltransferase/methylenetetrahydrofolate reductase [Spirochaetales bacterium]|nr:bifunctional homocysteine S-methyltransferase/methylenetetrahydrofolate reductase [Spirochaetales bacterium]